MAEEADKATSSAEVAYEITQKGLKKMPAKTKTIHILFSKTTTCFQKIICRWFGRNELLNSPMKL